MKRRVRLKMADLVKIMNAGQFNTMSVSIPMTGPILARVDDLELEVDETSSEGFRQILKLAAEMKRQDDE